MAIFLIHHPLVFTFGLLGTIISFMVYLVPLRTFYGIYKKKSTEGFQSTPYVVALFSSMLWMYYAFVKTGAPLLITINSFGCVIEAIYIAMYITYAPSKARVFTTKLLVFLNFGVFSLILLVTIILVKGTTRVNVLGWVCVAFSVTVFAAPLSIVRQVIRTKSVEFMPFPLSFFLMLSAVMWFSYGFFLKDIYIALPNIIGFVFGVLQMVLYAIYKDPIIEEIKLPQKTCTRVEKVDDCLIDIQPVDCEHNIDVNHQRLHEQVDRNQPLEIKLSEFEAQIPAIAVAAQKKSTKGNSRSFRFRHSIH